MRLSGHCNLTRRQQDVLRLVTDSLTIDEMARRLVLSRETIRSHLTRLRECTETHDMRQLAMWAVDHTGCCVLSRRRDESPTA